MFKTEHDPKAILYSAHDTAHKQPRLRSNNAGRALILCRSSGIHAGEVMVRYLI